MRVTSCLMIGLLFGIPAQGQVPEYEPSHEWPGVTQTTSGVEFETTQEVLAVMISSSKCGGNGVEGFDQAIRRMKATLSARADSLGYAFAAIGVATDFDVRTGVQYLLEGESTLADLSFGAWDEIVTGRNWLDAASSLYVLDLGIQELSVPTVFILERTVTPAMTYAEVTRPTLLHRISGGERIVEWASNGWKVPELRN